ncbi:MAG: hypothetical protein WA393_06980 [Nitrososphaeraceae archaeon]
MRDEANDTMTGKDDRVDTLGDKMSDLLWLWFNEIMVGLQIKML